jgi:hypothetical protein
MNAGAGLATGHSVLCAPVQSGLTIFDEEAACATGKTPQIG